MNTNIKNLIQMKKIVGILMMSLIYISMSFAQDESPVWDVWATEMLIENQTMNTPEKGRLSFIIHHRFGEIESVSDLFGIYAPSNIRMGLNYGITEKIMVGIGTEKNNKLQDIQWKYRFLTQTAESNKMPVSVAYYGNMAIDAREDEAFGQNYEFTNRLSYFHQLIVSRKISEKLSVQAAASYSHFNAVDSVWLNNILGFHIGGRYKFYNEMSFIVDYTHPLQLMEPLENYHNEFKPNISFGIEIFTGTHAFQIFATTAENIIAQKNTIYNMNDITMGEMVYGFNISVKL